MKTITINKSNLIAFNNKESKTSYKGIWVLVSKLPSESIIKVINTFTKRLDWFTETSAFDMRVRGAVIYDNDSVDCNIVLFDPNHKGGIDYPYQYINRKLLPNNDE